MIESASNTAGAAVATAASSKLVGGLGTLAASYALTSAWNALTKDPTRDIFYTGEETPIANIPQKGIVTYKGKDSASRYDNVNAGVKNKGDVTLVANFDNKTIKGELDMTYPRRNISLHEAPIIGNSFEGKAITEGNFPFFLSQDGKF